MRMPSDRPSAASAVLISSIDFSPRFLTVSRSASVFCTRSATIEDSAFLSALMARAGSGSSSSGLARLSCRKPSPGRLHLLVLLRRALGGQRGEVVAAGSGPPG